MHRRIPIAAVLASFVAAVGCGPSRATLNRGASTTTFPTTSLVAANTTNTTSSPAPTPGPPPTSQLQRRDSPAGGLARQAGFFGGGADPPGCEDVFPDNYRKPTIGVPGATSQNMTSGIMSVGLPGHVCYFGFNNGPLQLTIIGPGGRFHEETYCFGCAPYNFSIWRSFPGDPLGAYSVTVRQGRTSVNGTVRLVRQTTPVLVVRESPGFGVPSVAAGSAVSIGLAGFPASSVVRVGIYHSSDVQSWGRYVTSLSMRVDQGGEGVHRLETRADDPRGCYSFHTAPEIELATTWVLTGMNGICLR